MTLATDVQARIPESRLRQLTNPGDPTATSTDATVLGLAATDISADFEVHTGVVYDGTVATHLSVAVDGVLAKLYQWTEGPGGVGDKRYEAFVERCIALGKVTGRDRIVPSTNSPLTVRPENPSGEEVYPDSERDNFRKLVPGAPLDSTFDVERWRSS